eukprot:2137476-Rhodomonas_salina.1
MSLLTCVMSRLPAVSYPRQHQRQQETGLRENEGCCAQVLQGGCFFECRERRWGRPEEGIVLFRARTRRRRRWNAVVPAAGRSGEIAAPQA